MFVVKEIPLTAPSLSVKLPKGTKVIGAFTRENSDPVVLVQVPLETDKEEVEMEIYTMPSGNHVKLSMDVNYVGTFEIPLPPEILKDNKKHNNKDTTMCVHIFYLWKATSGIIL